MTIEIEWDRISIDGEEIIPQYPIKDSIVTDERMILRIEYQKSSIEDFDFAIEDQSRNIVSLTLSGERDWVIEPVTSEEDAYHKNLWTLQDRFITRHQEGNFEFDPETGKILNKWSHTKLPIADKVVELSGEVSRIVEFEDTVFVQCRQATHDLYAFETDGTERWRSDADERRGYFYIEDGNLWERTTHNRTTDRLYRFDHATGERLELVEEIDTGLW